MSEVPWQDPARPRDEARRRWPRVGLSVAVVLVAAVALVLGVVPAGRRLVGLDSGAGSSTAADKKPAVALLHHEPADAIVSVADAQGQPIDGATVAVLGTEIRAVSGSDGQARLPLQPGLYRLAIGTSGYFQATHTLSVPSSGSAEPLAITLQWAPAVGTYVAQQSPTVTDVLVIESLEPLDATVVQDEWHCYEDRWTYTDATQLSWDGTSDGFDTSSSFPSTVLVGPGQLPTQWVLDGPQPDLSHVPDQGICETGTD